MLIMPLHRALTRANFPWVTVALVIANAFVFFALQLGDGADVGRAYAYYAEHGLGEKEIPAYRAWIERERGARESAHDTSETSGDERRDFHELFAIEADAPFLAELEADRVITPGTDGFAEWKRDRVEFDALWNRNVTQRWVLRYSEIAPTRMLGSMFLHGGVGHLAGNMLFLLMLGLLVEGALGPLLFLALYLLGGVGGAFAALAWHWGQAGMLLGASGAIASLMGAYCVLWGTRRVRFFWWFFIVFDYVKAPALILLPFWLGWELLNLVFSDGSHVAFEAHAGGIVTGALLALGVRALGWARNDFLDEDRIADETAAANAALAKADAHIGRLEIPAARALLEPLAERAPDDVAVAAALYRCARYERGTPRLDAAARIVLAMRVAGGVAARAQKDVYDDYLKARGDRAIVPPSLAIGLASRWPAIGAGADAAKLLARVVERAPGAQGLEDACLALARTLRERGERASAVGVLEHVVRAWPASAGAEKARILLADI
ncbi:MAG: rhomboid family intramembrane serine protease [Rhodanobacteraceae bacterium]